MQYSVIDTVFNCRKLDKEEFLQKVSQKIQNQFPSVSVPSKSTCSEAQMSLLKLFPSLRCQNSLVPTFSHINIQHCLINTFSSLKEFSAQEHDDPCPNAFFHRILKQFLIHSICPNILSSQSHSLRPFQAWLKGTATQF